MLQRKWVVWVLAALCLLGVANPLSAQHETLTFRVKSEHQFKAQIAFYGAERNVAWPGNNRAYNLDDNQVKSFTLTCNGGERICYGAWVTGNAQRYWGAGNGGKQRCERCCYVCNSGQTPIITLN